LHDGGQVAEELRVLYFRLTGGAAVGEFDGQCDGKRESGIAEKVRRVGAAS
jgi:hypothetical protein